MSTYIQEQSFYGEFHVHVHSSTKFSRSIILEFCMFTHKAFSSVSRPMALLSVLIINHGCFRSSKSFIALCHTVPHLYISQVTKFSWTFRKDTVIVLKCSVFTYQNWTALSAYSFPPHTHEVQENGADGACFSLPPLPFGTRPTQGLCIPFLPASSFVNLVIVPFHCAL